MKAISLIQPWATLLVHGFKQHETRRWKVAYRGPLAIHASRNFPETARRLCMENEHFRAALQSVGIVNAAGDQVNERDLFLGCVIGCVRLEDVVSTNDLDTASLSAAELQFGDFRQDRYAWRCSAPSPLVVPIPARGMPGLWTLPEEQLWNAA